MVTIVRTREYGGRGRHIPVVKDVGHQNSLSQAIAELLSWKESVFSNQLLQQFVVQIPCE